MSPSANTMNQPTLYQIIPGGDLLPHQLRQILLAFPQHGLGWVTKQSYYFSKNGKQFLEVWK